MAGPQPTWTPSQTDLEKIERWTSEGMTETSIAAAFGITRRTFWKKKKDHPEIQESIDNGKTKDEQLCVNRLREFAFSDNKNALSALIFYMKARHNWDDKAGQNNQSAPKGVQLKQIDGSKDSNKDG